MFVDHSGWTEELGAFCCKISFDETKMDFAVHFENGSVARQSSNFQYHTADWNRDGDVYTQFGAWFEFRDTNGKFTGGEFFTPVDLVQFAIDARDPNSHCFGSRPVKVDGIVLPLPPRHQSLADRIAQTENRAAKQEAERNRKMNALGIRPSNEPWAR